jgi:hypothetical protein
MRLAHGLTLLTGLLFAAMAWHALPLQPVIPQLQITFTEHAFRTVLAQWSAADLARFHDHFFWDFPFLVVYGFWGWVLVRQNWGLRHEHPPRGMSGWAWCTPVASGLDALENILHLHLVFTPGPFHAAEYALAGSVCTTKWVLLISFGLKLAQVFFGRRGSTHG